MIITAKEHLQRDLVKAAVENSEKNENILVIFAKDRKLEVNRDLMLLVCPLLRQLLCSPTPDPFLPPSLPTLVLPSCHSSSILLLQSLISGAGSLPGPQGSLSSQELGALVETASILGMDLSNIETGQADTVTVHDSFVEEDIIDSLENETLEEYTDVDEEEQTDVDEHDNSVEEISTLNPFHYSPANKQLKVDTAPIESIYSDDLQIKVEAEYAELELLDNSDGDINAKLDAIKSEMEDDISISKPSSDPSRGDETTTDLIASETMTEVRLSSDAQENASVTNTLGTEPTVVDTEILLQSPESSHAPEATLNIEIDQSEINDLLSKTKDEIEKILRVKPIEHLLGNTESSPDIREDSQKNADHPPTPLTEIPEEPQTKDQSSTSKKETINNTSGKELENGEDYNSITEASAYPCDQCSFKTNKADAIKKHVKVTHQCFYRFRCHRCSFASPVYDRFQTHSCTEHTKKQQTLRPGSTSDGMLDRELSCNHCNYKSRVAEDLMLHSKQNHGALFYFPCSTCPFTTRSLPKFLHHTSSSCSTSESSPHPALKAKLCLRCGRRHSTSCSFPPETVCSEPNCAAPNGHARSLHHPANGKDFKIIAFNNSDLNIVRPPSKTGKSRQQPKAHPCSKCKYVSAKAENIKMHMKKTHKSLYLFKCDKCDFSTTEDRLMPAHVCRSTKALDCPHCDVSVDRPNVLTRHIRTQHEDIMISCDRCDHMAISRESLTRHMKTNCQGGRGSTVKCDLCGVRLLSNTALTRHMMTSHGQVEDGQLYTCDLCHYTSSDLESLNNHMVSHQPRARSPSPSWRPSSRSSSRRSYSPEYQGSRGGQSPHRRSVTPLTQEQSPHHLYIPPAQPSDLVHRPSRSSSRRGPRVRPTGKGGAKTRTKTLLCLRCGRRHATACRFPENVHCTEPSCPSPQGHVDSLHRPRTLPDQKLIRSKMPGLKLELLTHNRR